MKTYWILSLCLGITLVGCNTTKTTTTTTTTTTTITNSEEAFCQQLLQQSVQEDENVFLSPASAAMALNILTPGADGITLKELQTVVPKVQLDTTEQLQVASALWINEGLSVQPAFLEANATAEVYHGAILVDKVNQWASDKTHGKVNKVLDEPLPPIQMAITNALYFNAEWVEPFRSRSTRPEPFYGKKRTSQVPTMHQTSFFLYAETEHTQAVRLSYIGGYCMEVILPKKGVRLEDGIKDAYSLEFRGEEKKVALALPKFSVEYEKQLNDYLKQMGLKSCFTNEADFSRISDTPLHVDFIKQNTYVSVDEVGTEAAAVTTIGLAKMARMPEPEELVEMTINRPFIFFIREVRSQQVLFYGVINNL